VAVNELTSLSRVRAGRPTREQAEARRQQLLDTALDHFLEKGFELTTIEAIAHDVGMTKRTVYARYPDKVALFHAAVNLAIERYTVAPEQIAATDSGDIEETLVAIAWLRIEQVLTPNGLRLQRIINAESYRFPDVFVRSFELSGLPTVRFLESVLTRETHAGTLALDKPAAAANVVMSMVVGGPVRSLLLGLALSREEIDKRIRFAVRLFLEGARAR
jgi:TetR/AcrR family transcriptional regulator, mexJK operon transcriptional repressor